MKMIAFDVHSSVAHFRRPDTTATHLTYPFISPTAAKGLVGAILGIEDFQTNDKVGIQLLSPVMTVAQQMSMLGKDGGTSFNRPTTVELLINPAYRIYYAGDEYVDDLLSFLHEEKSVYPTYLGSAYALTKPVLYKSFNSIQSLSTGAQRAVTRTVVPVELIKEIAFQPDHSYSRAGGFLREYKGERQFEKSIDFLYEREGKAFAFAMAEAIPTDLQVIQTEEEIVCLV